MDSLKAKYRPIVEQLLVDYAEFLGNDEVQMELVFDRALYFLVETGWQNGYRIYGSLLHFVAATQSEYKYSRCRFTGV